MKASKLHPADREIRRNHIMDKRRDMIAAWTQRGISFIQSKTTRKVFRKTKLGGLSISHSSTPYPHSSERQRARYARQIATAQLDMAGA